MRTSKRFKLISVLIITTFCFTTVGTGYLHFLEEDTCHKPVTKNSDSKKHDHCTLCKVTHQTFFGFTTSTVTYTDHAPSISVRKNFLEISYLYILQLKRGPPLLS